MSSPSPIILRVSAFGGAALVASMLLLFVACGVGQEPLRALRVPSEYALLLAARPHVLCAVITLDNLFVVAYATLFLELWRVITARGASPEYGRAASALLLIVALLDLAENLHFLTMLRATQSGMALSPTEIRLQHWASLLTFHIAHVGIFLLGIALPRATRAESVLAWSCGASPLLGFAVYTTSPPYSQPLLYARFAYFVTTLVALGWIYGGAGNPSSHGARTHA